MAPRDDQRGPARIATISALIVVASFVAGKAERDAILLAQFDIKTLPIFIGISAVFSLPIILMSGRLMARFGPARLIPVLNAASAALAFGEWCFLPHYPRLIAVIAFFHFATMGAVLVSGFWSIVNERFDIQTAKRHIARIGIGATLGGILGGVIAERSAVYLPPDTFLLVLAGLQLACAVTLYRFGGVARSEPAVATPAGTWLPLRVAMGSPLLRGLGGIVVLGAIAAGAMDYVFKADIVSASSHEGLLRSLAIFYTVTSIVTAIVQGAVCGPLLTRLGAPRSVATLPFTITVFSVFALIIRLPFSAAIARGAETVVRNSVYRAGYELVYAPLPEEHKRPAKVMLDVGAERLGDLLGAQLVTLIVYATASPRTGLFTASLCIGALAVVVAMRLPRSYTRALEDSLLTHAQEAPRANPNADDEAPPWLTLNEMPSFGQAGEFAPLSLRFRDRKPAKRLFRAGRAVAAPPAGNSGRPARWSRRIVDAVADLSSGDPVRIRRALAGGLSPELAGCAVDLVGRDDVGRDAIAALTAVAPRCTGMLVDALLDQRREVMVRRRLPAVLLAGEPSLAVWGLWRALGDPSFDVRYRSGAVLARLAADGHLDEISIDDVFDTVRRELLADHGVCGYCQVVDDLAGAGDAQPEEESLLQRAGAGLTHIFTVLGLVLPAEPLRIALHAVQTDDPELRGTALEYLESVLPLDLRDQLWPLLAAETAAAAEPPVAPAAPEMSPPEIRAMRSHDEILAALRQSYPTILERLRERVKPA